MSVASDTDSGYTVLKVVGFVFLIILLLVDFSTFFPIALLVFVIYILVKSEKERPKQKDYGGFQDVEHYSRRNDMYISTRKRSMSKKNNKLSDDKTEITKEEIYDFFKSLDRKFYSAPIDPKEDTRLDDVNFNMFREFIGVTQRDLKITTNVFDSRVLCELLWPLRDKNITVDLITRRIQKEAYITEFKKQKHKLKLNITRLNQIHAKIILRDEHKLLIGSSNLDNASLSRTGFFMEANTITSKPEAVSSALNFFNSLSQQQDLMDKPNDVFLYSRVGEDHLPLALKKYFIKEHQEIIMIMPLGLIDWSVLEKILEWNNKTIIKLFIGDNLPSNTVSSENIKSLRQLEKCAKDQYKNLKVIIKHKPIHAKTYIFRSQELVFVSSQNLTTSSWNSMLESGILIKDVSTMNRCIDIIKNLEAGSFTISGDYEEVDAPESTWQGTASEKKKGIPWSLPVSDETIRFQKVISGKYYMLKKKPDLNEKSMQMLLKLQQAGERKGNSIYHKTNEELKEENYARFGKESVTMYRKKFR